MRVVFFEPPPHRRIGGLDAAIRHLEAALRDAEIQIIAQPPADDASPTVAHFHGLWEPSFPALARTCVRRGIPIVVSPHGMLEPWAWKHKRWKKWPYFQLIEKRWLSRACCLLATGSAEAARLLSFFPNARVESLPLGMTGTAGVDYANARHSLAWMPQETVLLFLSRLHQKKGLDLLLRGLAGLPWPEYTRLVVVGEGDPSYVGEIKHLAHDLAPQLPPVEFVGGVWGDDRWRFFQGADLFCLPSHSENFGLAVLEACQVGTPVLTTDQTPWGSLLPAEHSFIVQPGVDSVREGLQRFFQQPRRSAEQRKALSDWAFENFAWDRLVGSYIKLYRSLTPPSRDSHPL